MKAGVQHLFRLLPLLCLLAACPTTEATHTGNSQAGLIVSKELYEKTFSEILQFLKKLDGIIATKDFQVWKESCTPEYLTLQSSPERLKELSQKPYLKERHIALTSLEDFFLFVFIPSRVETKLDKVDFIGQNRVKAITVVEGVPYVVYLLEKDQNNQWKIGVW